MDRIEIEFEGRRLHARIDRRKATTDIDDIDRNRRFDNRGANALDGLRIGMGAHCLATDMEADA